MRSPHPPVSPEGKDLLAYQVAVDPGAVRQELHEMGSSLFAETDGTCKVLRYAAGVPSTRAIRRIYFMYCTIPYTVHALRILLQFCSGISRADRHWKSPAPFNNADGEPALDQVIRGSGQPGPVSHVFATQPS